MKIIEDTFDVCLCGKLETYELKLVLFHVSNCICRSQVNK